MKVDLTRMLETIVDGAATQASPVPVDRVLGRLHRRRAARTAATAGLTVAAVAAVAVAAVALPGGLMTTTPPAGPPDPTATEPVPVPVPDTTIDGWPPAITFDGPVPGCGAPMPALVRPDDGPDIVVDSFEVGALVAGEVAEFDVSVRAPAELRLLAGDPEVLLVRDGVVVATNREPEFANEFGHTSVESALSWVGVSLSLTRCGLTGQSDPALDPGSYDAYPVIRLYADEQELVVVGGPFPLQLAEPEWRLDPAAAVPAGVPVIGQVLRVETHTDGDAWRVSTLIDDHGTDSYAVARDALVAAGFTVDAEDLEADQPWNADAVLRSGDYVVELAVGNATGAGWYASYVITRR